MPVEVCDDIPEDVCEEVPQQVTNYVDEEQCADLGSLQCKPAQFTRCDNVVDQVHSALDNIFSFLNCIC